MLRNTHHGKNCAYCNRVMDRGDYMLMPTRDHVIPRTRGGNQLVICCQQCNCIKADMMPGQWEVFMTLHPRWWLLSKGHLRIARRGIFPTGTKGMKPRRAKQGTAPLPPVIVPPELIYAEHV